MRFKHAVLSAIFVLATVGFAQDKAETKPLTPEEFMKKVNAYLREQDAAVTEELKAVRDTLQKVSADMDQQTKTIAGLQEKLKELQQELAKVQLENVRLKKDTAKVVAAQQETAELVAAERQARAAGDLKLANQLAAIIKKTNAIIRETTEPDPQPTGGAAQTYVVQAGDTLGAIAKAYGTTVAKIKEANGLANNTIRIGQKLEIPGNAP